MRISINNKIRETKKNALCHKKSTKLNGGLSFVCKQTELEVNNFSMLN